MSLGHVPWAKRKSSVRGFEDSGRLPGAILRSSPAIRGEACDEAQTLLKLCFKAEVNTCSMRLTKDLRVHLSCPPFGVDDWTTQDLQGRSLALLVLLFGGLSTESFRSSE